MSKNKKVKYSEVMIAGEILDISNMEVKWPNTPGEREVFKLSIETESNETMSLVFDNAVYGFDGQPNNKAEGALTIYNEAKTRAKDGKGDMVRCMCKIDNQQYYSNGELKEFMNIKVDYCHRAKGNEIIKPEQLWKIDTLIKSMEMKNGALGEYLEVKGLINDYISSTGKIKGTPITYRVSDPDMIEGFKDMYMVGSVAKIEGQFREEVIQVESGKRTFGRVTQTKPQIERWLEVVGGEESYNTIYDETTLKPVGLKDITDNNHPFSVDNIKAMEEKMAEQLQKSKEKDEQKMANSQTISDDDVPF